MSASLSDALAEFAAREHPKPNACRIARLFEEVGPEAAALLAAMIDDPRDSRKTAREIASFMADHGYDLNERLYAMHRRRGENCRCPKVSA